MAGWEALGRRNMARERQVARAHHTVLHACVVLQGLQRFAMVRAYSMLQELGGKLDIGLEILGE